MNEYVETYPENTLFKIEFGDVSLNEHVNLVYSASTYKDPGLSEIYELSEEDVYQIKMFVDIGLGDQICVDLDLYDLDETERKFILQKLFNDFLINHKAIV